MARPIKAYLVCRKCGGYGEQTPSNTYEEEKLRRALASKPVTRLPCPQCGDLLELLTPEDFYIKKIKRVCLILAFLVISFVGFAYAIRSDTATGAQILIVLIVAQFFFFHKFLKNRRKRLIGTINDARPESGNNFQEWRSHILSGSANPHARTYHHGGPCPFCGESRFGRVGPTDFVCTGCNSAFKILSDRTGDFYFCEGREASSEQIRRDSLSVGGEYDRLFTSKPIMISKHKE